MTILNSLKPAIGEPKSRLPPCHVRKSLYGEKVFFFPYLVISDVVSFFFLFSIKGSQPWLEKLQSSTSAKLKLIVFSLKKKKDLILFLFI